jgi:hypothetical protein
MNKTIFISIFLIIGLSNLGHAQDNMIFREHGVQYITSLSFHNGIYDVETPTLKLQNNTPIFSLHQVVGYQFNPYFNLGLGLGFEKWRKTSFIPLYADMRFNILRGRYSPHVMLNLGYSNKWYESPRPDPTYQVIHGATEGLFFEGGLGFKAMFKHSRGMFLAISYKIQETDIKFSDELNDMPRLTTNRAKRVMYHFVGIRAGILF